MTTTHVDHKYSITVQTDDLAVVGCLRALAKFSQKFGNNQIPWGGTKDKDWERDHGHVTFRFSTPEYRNRFLSEAERLLPKASWKPVDTSDNDPASPQRPLVQIRTLPNEVPHPATQQPNRHVQFCRDIFRSAVFNQNLLHRFDFELSGILPTLPDTHRKPPWIWGDILPYKNLNRVSTK